MCNFLEGVYILRFHDQNLWSFNEVSAGMLQ